MSKKQAEGEEVEEAVAASRLSKAREKLSSNQLDAFFTSEQPNLRYLSGFSGSTGIVLITRSDSFIVTDGRYFEQVEQEVVGYSLKRLPVGRPYIDYLCDLFRELSLSRVGYESENLSVAFLNRVRSLAGDVELVPTERLVEDLRLVKSEDEVQLIKQAAELSFLAFRKIISESVGGRTERELAARLEYEMRLLGSERLQFEVILCSGARSSIIHGKPSDKALERGDLVIVDFGFVLDGYCSDVTRTCVVGEPSADQRRLFSLLKEAQHSAALAARPQVLCKQVDSVARNIISQAGFGEAFAHGLGHGIGLQVHEAPQLSPASETRLQSGMTITLEPGVYFPGKGGLRLEDDFVVTSDGAVRLTDSLPQELFVLPE